MQVYIEDAVLQNLIINYMLLSISNFAINEKSKWYKLLLVSLFGAGVALLLSLFRIKVGVLIPIKILCAVLITLFMTNGNNIKKYLLFFFVFLSSTFIMGGCVGALQNLFQKKLSALAITVIIASFYVILKNIIRQFYIKRKIDKFYYNIDLLKDGELCKIKAYLDSGNLLQDEKTGLPILIVNYATLEKLFRNKITVVDFLQQKLDKKVGGRYIEYETVSGRSKMFICQIDQVIISTGEEIEVMIGVGNGFKGKDYQALLSPLAI